MVSHIQSKVTKGNFIGSYQGVVVCYEGKRELWREKTTINRLTPEIAWNDANRLASDILNMEYAA